MHRLAAKVHRRLRCGPREQSPFVHPQFCPAQ
jgi:hypothetical protein